MTRATRPRIAWFIAAALATVPVLVLTIAAVSTAHRTDLKCFWTGARLVASGLDPYDAAVWGSAVAGTFENVLGRPGPSPCPGAYGYPLTTAVLTFPLALAPLELAAAAWAIAGIAGLAAGITFLGRSARIGRDGALALAFVTLASQPAWWNAIFLQYGGILVAGLGVLALSSTSGSRALSVAATLSLALKPHVAPIALVERLAAAPPRARTAAILALGAVVIVPTIFFPAWPLQWMTALASDRPRIAEVSPTFWALVSAVTGRADVAFIASWAAAGAFLTVLRGVELRDGIDRMAVATVAWMLVVPYGSAADLLVLTVAWCALIRRGHIGLALVVAVLVPWAAFRVDPTLGLGAVAPVTAAALGAVLRTRALTDRPRAAMLSGW